MSATTTGKEKLQVVLAGPEHVAALAEFYRETWSPEATAEGVAAARSRTAAQNPVEPGIPYPTWVALLGSRIVGHCGSLPFVLWNGHESRPAYVSKGLSVLPEFRKGPIGYSVLNALARGLDRSGAFVVDLPARRLFVALGYVDYGPLPNFVLPLRMGRFLQRLDVAGLGSIAASPLRRMAVRTIQRTGAARPIGWITGGVLRGIGALGSIGSGRFEARIVDVRPTEAELDALWARVRAGLAATPDKSGRLLLQRYGPGGPMRDRLAYAHTLVSDGAGPIGWAAVRRPSGTGDPRLNGIAVAVLSDIVFPADQAKAGLATIAAAERLARRMGADAVLATPSHGVFAPLLRRRAWVRLPGNVHFFMRDPGGEWPSELSRWWLHRGDGHSDDVF